LSDTVPISGGAWKFIKTVPFFYSLGNFIFQSDSTERQPTEFYDLYNLGPDNTVSDGLEKRSLNETRGLAADPRVYESAVISVTAENGEILSADIHPITLGFHKNRPSKGLPELASGEAAESVLQHIRDLSGPYGTVIDVKNGTGSVRLR
jgi:poly-gamma-glutamate synthesis protein (capsule biosynthesis protein)